MSGIAMRLEAVLDGRDSRNRRHALHELIDLGFEHGALEGDGTAARDDVDCARMRDQPPESGAHPFNENLVGRGAFLDQLVERASRQTARSVANIARRHSHNGLGAMRNVRSGLGYTRSPAAAAARIQQVHRRGPQADTSERDCCSVHASSPVARFVHHSNQPANGAPRDLSHGN
jgi:hypothetical protein